MPPGGATARVAPTGGGGVMPPVGAPPTAGASEHPRTRDAGRSREAILAAGERLFGAHGYEGTSLAQIGAAASLSRGAPAYFFGGKPALYDAVIERVFDAREAAVRPHVEPILAWATGPAPGDLADLRAALEHAAGGYLAFLAERPDFVRLVEREALAGGRRLASAPHASTAVEDGLHALHAAAPRHGLRPFDPGDALIAFVALCFFPLAHRDTFLARLGRDPDDPAFRAARARQAAGAVLQVVAP